MPEAYNFTTYNIMNDERKSYPIKYRLNTPGAPYHTIPYLATTKLTELN